MLKQTITYDDFDDNTQTETLYFNITKTELTKNIDLKDELEVLEQMLAGEERDLKTAEIQQIVNLVERFARLSYGIRDGKRFVKTPELWEELTQTAAYDAWFMGLFEDTSKALDFLSGVMPKKLMAEAQDELDALRKKAMSDNS